MATAPVFIGAQRGCLCCRRKPVVLLEPAALATELTLDAISDETLAMAEVNALLAEPSP